MIPIQNLPFLAAPAGWRAILGDPETRRLKVVTVAGWRLSPPAPRWFAVRFFLPSFFDPESKTSRTEMIPVDAKDQPLCSGGGQILLAYLGPGEDPISVAREAENYGWEVDGLRDPPLLVR